MSQPAGQVSGRQAIGGLVVGIAVLAAIVWLCRALLLPEVGVEPLPPPPPQDTKGPIGTVSCPAESALLPPPVSVTSSEVIDCPEVYDGHEVAYRGEIVGAVLRRGARAWVQLNDDGYGLRLGPLPSHRSTVGGNSGLAVSIPIAVAAEITHVGGHSAHGDRISVTGIFHAEDPADGGGITIQATAAEITQRGAGLSHPLSRPRITVAGLLSAATVVLALVVRRSRSQW